MLNARDTINGGEASLTATIDGQVEVLAYIKSFESQVVFNKVEVPIIGRRGTSHKVTGWSGDGSMVIHYITSKYRRIAEEYKNTGRLPDMTLVGENADAQSSVGRQTVSHTGVLIDGVDLFRLDAEREVLEETIGFTFDDFAILDEFGQPVAG